MMTIYGKNLKLCSYTCKQKSVPARLTMAVAITVIASCGILMTASAATLEISGKVEETCSVSVSNLAVSLDLLNGESAKSVAVVSETCNDPDGYTVSISSSNAKLDGPAGLGVDYSINYDSLNSADPSGNRNTVFHSAPAWNNTVDLQINLAGNGHLAAGIYTDTITITIAGQ